MDSTNLARRASSHPCVAELCLNKTVKTLRLSAEKPPVYKAGFRQKTFCRLSDFPPLYVTQAQPSFAGESYWVPAPLCW